MMKKILLVLLALASMGPAVRASGFPTVFALGFRLYRTAPVVELEAVGDKGRVKRMKVNFYSL